MKRYFIISIITMLSVSAALVSCSSAFDKSYDDTEGRLIITGTVSALESSQVLSDIKIVFNAYHSESDSNYPIYSDEVYSGSDGIYFIEAEARGKLRCTVMAIDMSGQYESQSFEIMVTWSGQSYDKTHNSFIVNECNFRLPKTRR